jgi:hypothetical protein
LNSRKTPEKVLFLYKLNYFDISVNRQKGLRLERDGGSLGCWEGINGDHWSREGENET